MATTFEKLSNGNVNMTFNGRKYSLRDRDEVYYDEAKNRLYIVTDQFGKFEIDYRTVSAPSVASNLALFNELAANFFFKQPASSEIAEADYIDFNTEATSVNQEGRLKWNTDDGVLEYGMPGGNVNQQIGMELFVPRAKAAVDIANGQLVYISSADGANPIMSLAKADDSDTSNKVLAMATENVSANHKGYFTSFGLVRDVNTTGMAEGTLLYLSADDAGGYVTTKPAAPNYAVRIGYVIRTNASEGVIFVYISQRTNNYYNIRGLSAGSIVIADINGFLNQLTNNVFYNLSTKIFYVGNITSGNYLSIDEAGQVRLYGDATQYDDLRIAADATKLGGSKDPNFEKIFDNGSGSQGVFSYAFDASTEQEVYFSIQLPHSWKQETDILPHVHWIAKINGAAGQKVGWGFEYTWANVAGVFGSTNIIYADANILNEDIIANKHYITAFSALSGTDKTFSSMLLCRLFRDAGSTNTTDNYPNDAILLEIDFHYQVDSFGSNQEYVKY